MEPFYHVSKEWKEAIKYGWDSACTQNANILTFHEGKENLTAEQVSALREVIRDKLPVIFECFYRGVDSLLAGAARNENAIIDVVEETLASSLGEALLWLGAWIDQSLIGQE